MNNLITSYHILLVDDDEDLLYISKIYIERFEGFFVDVVSSVQKGIRQLNICSYDAIVSDYDMPEMNGIAFFEKMGLQRNFTPFIIFSSKSRDEIASVHLIPEPIFFLQKQANPQLIYRELVLLIRLVVSNSSKENKRSHMNLIS